MRLVGLWLVVVWCASGCACEPLGVETFRFACQSAADCAPGYECLAGECARPQAAADAGVQPDGGASDAGQLDAGQADAGPRPRLAFAANPPAFAVSGTALTAQPQVEVLSETGTRVTTSTAPVTLGAFSDATCATVAAGTLTTPQNPLAATDGLARFDSVAVTSATPIYLGASSPGFDAACAGPIAFAGALFSEQAAARGVADTQTSDMGFATFADLDEDGVPDLLVGSKDAGSRLFFNRLPPTFAPGRVVTNADRALIAGDCDGDGWRDLFFTGGTPDFQVLHNQRDGGFRDVTAASGVLGLNVQGAAVLDFDQDGRLDLFMPSGTTGSAGLWRGAGDCTFTDVTTQAGLPDAGLGNGELVMACDYDVDGDVDLFYTVAQGLPDGGPLHLFRNEGAGRFSSASTTAGLGPNTLTQYRAGLGLGDVDNDGDFDLFVGRAGAWRSTLYRTTAGVFAPVTTSPLSALTGDVEDAVFADFDNDGWLDAFVVMNGAPDVLYRNLGDGQFAALGASSGLSGVFADKDSSGAAVADVDNDGDLDVYVNHRGASASRLYVNQHQGPNFLKVRVRGRGGVGRSPLDGTGAVVQLFDAPGTTLLATREVSGGLAMSQSEALVHFGLAGSWGGAGGTYTVKVRFTSGQHTHPAPVVPSAATVVVGGTTLKNTVLVVEPP